MITIEKYSPSFKDDWNKFLLNSRNGTFLINRDYMDYHADNFTDCSFLIYRKGKVVGLIPGNIVDRLFISHQGLTYGGIISNDKMKTKEIIELFDILDNTLKGYGVNEVIYKPVPLIYQRIPAQEDIYALFLKKAEKISCQISSAIYQENKIGFIESRKSGVRKAKKAGVNICDSNKFQQLWDILEINLKLKYEKSPVHSVDQIILLNERFPENIKLYAAELNDEIIAGAVIYLMPSVAHVQYISTNEIGKEVGALDLLFDRLINEVFTNIPVFDFGYSTEKSGNFLNESLIFQKEGFGGRGVVYEIYKYLI